MVMHALVIATVIGGLATARHDHLDPPSALPIGTVPHDAARTGDGAMRVAQQTLTAARRIRGRVLAGGGAAVTLHNPHGILLDATRADGDGNFSLDLGVLDDDELKSLKKCYIEIDVKHGRAQRVGLADIVVPDTGFVVLPDVKLP